MPASLALRPIPALPRRPVVDGDAALIVAAGAGDPEAVLALLARYRPPLVRLLAGVLGDWAAAEDAAQEALLHALRRLGDLRDPAAFYPWLRRSAVRLALRRRILREAPLDEAREAPASLGGVETRVVVHAVLRGLPRDLRAVLVLRELEGLDYAEIAGELAVPVGTVRSRLHAARARFREAWLRDVGPEEVP